MGTRFRRYRSTNNKNAPDIWCKLLLTLGVAFVWLGTFSLIWGEDEEYFHTPKTVEVTVGKPKPKQNTKSKTKATKTVPGLSSSLSSSKAGNVAAAPKSRNIMQKSEGISSEKELAHQGDIADEMEHRRWVLRNRAAKGLPPPPPPTGSPTSPPPPPLPPPPPVAPIMMAPIPKPGYTQAEFDALTGLLQAAPLQEEQLGNFLDCSYLHTQNKVGGFNFMEGSEEPEGSASWFSHFNDWSTMNLPEHIELTAQQTFKMYRYSLIPDMIGFLDRQKMTRWFFIGGSLVGIERFAHTNPWERDHDVALFDEDAMDIFYHVKYHKKSFILNGTFCRTRRGTYTQPTSHTPLEYHHRKSTCVGMKISETSLVMVRDHWLWEGRHGWHVLDGEWKKEGTVLDSQ